MLGLTLSRASIWTLFLCSTLMIPGGCNHASPSTCRGTDSSPAQATSCCVVQTQDALHVKHGLKLSPTYSYTSHPEAHVFNTQTLWLFDRKINYFKQYFLLHLLERVVFSRTPVSSTTSLYEQTQKSYRAITLIFHLYFFAKKRNKSAKFC